MLKTVHALRVVIGFIAAWQILGLLPVLSWLGNLNSTTGGMWGLVFIKLVVFLLCSALFLWLGRIKKRLDTTGTSNGELRTITIAIATLAAAGIAAAIIVPMIGRNSGPQANTDQVSSPQLAQPVLESPTGEIPPPPPGFVVDTPPLVEAQGIPPPPPGFVIDTPPSQENAPGFESKGWTQGSTGSEIFDPYQEAQAPRGTRYYRDATGIIFRVYPPGTRPELESANPFGLMESKAGPPI